MESEGDDDAATVAESVHAGDDDALDVDELLREIRAGVGRRGGEEDARADAEVASVMPEEVTGSHRPTHTERLSSGSVASFGGADGADGDAIGGFGDDGDAFGGGGDEGGDGGAGGGFGDEAGVTVER